MTPGRRPLGFDRFEQVMPDVERLVGGCSTVGNWSLAQICRHLSSALRFTVDLPASTPQDPSLWIGEERKRQVLASGRLAEGYAAPASLIPTSGLDARDESERLREAIAYYRASGGPVIPHLYIGPLTKEEWERFHLMHCAHHLSFATPRD